MIFSESHQLAKLGIATNGFGPKGVSQEANNPTKIKNKLHPHWNMNKQLLQLLN